MTEYLIALAEATRAIFLVSGDRDVLDIEYGPVAVRSPRDAVQALQFRHPWTEAAVPAGEAEIWRRTIAEGNDTVLTAASKLYNAVLTPDFAVLEMIVTPESLTLWRDRIAVAAAMLTDRGFTSRPEYPTPDIAYVKFVPNAGQNIMITADVVIPDAHILTMIRRPDLPDLLQVGGWRVHQLGAPAAIEHLQSLPT